MNETQIGIKLADGSFYPVLEEGHVGRKRLVLTTVRDNQEKVQIDLYRGERQRAEQTRYVGSLVIEGLAAAPEREPEIELEVGLDEGGNLEAVAHDARTGEKQTLSVSLQPAAAGAPQFELEGEGGLTDKEEDLEESLLTGETYPVGAADRRREHLHKRPTRRGPLLLILLLLLSLVLIAAIAFVVYRALSDQPVPALFTRRTAAPVQQQQPLASSSDSSSAAQPAPPPPAAVSPAALAPPAGGGVWYAIKWGDTLWDIAGTYYRNPWLYPKIAKANRISNPDLIIAGRQLFIPEN